jgi:hypothetical protein
LQKKKKTQKITTPCLSLTIANLKQKNVAHKFDAKPKKCRRLLLPQLRSMGLIIAKLQTCNKKQVEKLDATTFKFNYYKL